VLKKGSKTWNLFWIKVDKTSSNIFYKGTRCWEWTAGTHPSIESRRGRNSCIYGRFYINRIGQSAHRVLYEMKYGPISKIINVCHKCDNKLCVRPSHLFLGTQKDNIQDMINKKRNVKDQRMVKLN